MRNLIIALSIFFFALSGLIRIKESNVKAPAPASHRMQEQAAPRDVMPEVEKTLGMLTKEQEESRAKVRRLEAMIAGLEKRLTRETEKPDGKTAKPQDESNARVLAVLGEGVFDTGQIVINEALMETVHKIVPDILSYPERDLVIEGHTDNIPIRSTAGKGYKDNMELSFLRAKAVARVLVENGVPPERISVISYGETRPIASNDTPVGRAKNRRVVIKLLSSGEGYS